MFVRVGNLPDGYPDNSLRELFEKYGEVTECDVLKNFGFVHFRKPEEAERAKDGLSNHSIEGKRIRVESSGSGRGGGSSAAGTKLFVGRNAIWIKSMDLELDSLFPVRVDVLICTQVG